MHVPTIKKLQILVDPAVFGAVEHDPGCRGGMSSWIFIKTLEHNLIQIREPLEFEFLVPKGRLDEHTTNLYNILLPKNRIVPNETSLPKTLPFEGCSDSEARLVKSAIQCHGLTVVQ